MCYLVWMKSYCGVLFFIDVSVYGVFVWFWRGIKEVEVVLYRLCSRVWRYCEFSVGGSILYLLVVGCCFFYISGRLGD